MLTDRLASNLFHSHWLAAVWESVQLACGDTLHPYIEGSFDASVDRGGGRAQDVRGHERV